MRWLMTNNMNKYFILMIVLDKFYGWIFKTEAYLSRLITVIYLIADTHRISSLIEAAAHIFIQSIYLNIFIGHTK